MVRSSRISALAFHESRLGPRAVLRKWRQGVSARERASPTWERLKKHPLARLGPGLITGVADDDPSGIATYSQAGAQFGLNMLWTMPLAYPLMAAIQAMCAQIGRVTGKGLAANIKLAFPPIVLKGRRRCCCWSPTR